LYYDSLDKKRHQVSKLYLENATFVWNGNASIGKDNIQKFFQELPSSEHQMTTVDAQPIIDNTVSQTFTFLVQVSGTVKYQDSPSRAFQQTFMLTAQQDKWKIVNDCFRLQDGICGDKK
jgi:NTF2-related export protein 1/2